MNQHQTFVRAAERTAPQARYILPGLIPFSIFAGYCLSRRPLLFRRAAA